MKRVLVLAWIAFAWTGLGSGPTQQTNQAPTVLVFVGAPGEEEYGGHFQKSAQVLTQACHDAGARLIAIGLAQTDAVSDLDQIRAALAQEATETDIELWAILLGHGTFDGKEAKFNLRGPDLSATELANLLQSFRRPLAVINTTSSSGPFLKALSGTNRVVITATRSGYEQNYARFGQYFSAAITNPRSDLDKDGQVSLLEAFLTASHDVSEFYKTEGRLATEHPLLDDNGDGLGTPPEWFRGIRAIKKPAEGASIDGLRAHQFHLVRSDAERKLSPDLRARRNQLELMIEELRASKDKLVIEEYYQRLELLMIELASLYEASETE